MDEHLHDKGNHIDDTDIHLYDIDDTEYIEDIQKAVAREVGYIPEPEPSRPIPDRTIPERNKKQQEKYEYEENDQVGFEIDYDKYVERSKATRNLIITTVFIIIATAFLTWFACHFSNDMSKASLRNENKKYEETIASQEQTIDKLNQDIEDLKDNTTVRELELQIESLNGQIEELNKQLEEKDTQIEGLNDTLKEKDYELKEAQFRADMFQKYGPLWEK